MLTPCAAALWRIGHASALPGVCWFRKSSRCVGPSRWRSPSGGCRAAPPRPGALRDLHRGRTPHPVYGTPVFNVVPEAQEVAQAQQAWAQIEAAARAHGITIDPPGERLAQIRTVFDQLVAVAHRQQLPWQAHFLAVDRVNAFTFGGGMVIVFDGLFGGMVAPQDDDELAAVLAHEIAHVTLLHAPTRQTWTAFGSLAVKKTQNAYYRAAYTTEQEAEADRIAALYVALAGFDPMAALDTLGKHERAQNEQERRERMAAALQAIRIVQVWEQPTPTATRASSSTSTMARTPR